MLMLANRMHWARPTHLDGAAGRQAPQRGVGRRPAAALALRVALPAALMPPPVVLALMGRVVLLLRIKQRGDAAA